jgi:hypothetical protein
MRVGMGSKTLVKNGVGGYWLIVFSACFKSMSPV